MAHTHHGKARIISRRQLGDAAQECATARATTLSMLISRAKIDPQAQHRVLHSVFRSGRVLGTYYDYTDGVYCPVLQGAAHTSSNQCK